MASIITPSIPQHATYAQRRRALRIPPYVVAQLAYIAPHTLGRIERGERKTTPQEAERLAFVLDRLEAVERDAREHTTPLRAS